jgi:acyl carrier protein
LNIMDRMTAIFRRVFADDEIVIERTTTANDIDGWDSLSHTILIVAVERAFDLRFTPKELLTFRNVGDLLDSVEKKTGGKAGAAAAWP